MRFLCACCIQLPAPCSCCSNPARPRTRGSWRTFSVLLRASSDCLTAKTMTTLCICCQECLHAPNKQSDEKSTGEEIHQRLRRRDSETKISTCSDYRLARMLTQFVDSLLWLLLCHPETVKLVLQAQARVPAGFCSGGLCARVATVFQGSGNRLHVFRCHSWESRACVLSMVLGGEGFEGILGLSLEEGLSCVPRPFGHRCGLIRCVGQDALILQVLGSGALSHG